MPGGPLTAKVPTSGTLAFDDVDLTDTHTVSTALTGAVGVLNGVTLLNGVDKLPPGPLGLLEAALSASIANDSTGTGSGTIHWKLADLPVYIADFLTKGEVLTLTYTVTLTDSQGATTTENVVVTITGTDEAAVVWIDTKPVPESGALWSDPTNWETGTVPTANDDAIVITDQLHGLTPSFPVTIDAPAVAKSLTMNDFGTLPPQLINQSTLTIGGALNLSADSIVKNFGSISVGGLAEILKSKRPAKLRFHHARRRRRFQDVRRDREFRDDRSQRRHAQYPGCRRQRRRQSHGRRRSKADVERRGHRGRHRHQ